MWNWLEYLIYGTTTSRPSGSSPVITPLQEVALPSHRSSQVFDSHVLTEAAAGGKNPQAVSLAWDEGRAYGFNTAPQSWMGMTPRERKETLLSIFLANPWASNCIDTIALYITSGGYTIEPRVEKPDESQRDEIEQFLRRINSDWDFNQYVYDQITDEDIFGECFTEFTMKDGKPYQLFPIDCLTMDTRHDKYGRVTKYTQQLTSTSEPDDLDPKTIVRWWNPHKRAKVDPFSPLERIQDAILLDKKMTNWQTTFFQKGARYSYYFKGLGDQDEADRFLTYYRANFTGEKNAQTPPVLWGNAEIAPLGNMGPLDMSFDKGLDRMLTIVLSAFHVPPSIACIADVGNRLTDMSDSQRKILEYIACDPRRHRFFEKFNYRLIHPYFGSDYYVSSRYADFRSDTELAKMQDTRIRNGSITINETRQEMGKKAYEKGGDIALFAIAKEVMPVERLDEMTDEQRQTAQVTLDQAKANADLAQTKAKQAKESPQPMAQNGTPPPVQQSGSTNKTVQPLAKQGESLAQHIDRLVEQALQQHTGMMLALLLDPESARQLAIPGGEPAEELHITLAYLGDMNDPPALDGSYTPYTMPEPIKRVLTAVTSAARPLSGKIAGIGRFTTQPDDETPTPIVANVDVPGLTELRTELVDALSQANYFVADTHGYTAHITLAYIDQDAPMPIEGVPPLELTFDTVWLCVGDERIPFKLGGIEPPPIGENHEKQETSSQSDATDDLIQGPDQDQSDGSLHQAQEAPHGSGKRDLASSGVLHSDATTLSGSASRERAENDEVGSTSLSSREDGSQAEARGSADQQSVADRQKVALARWIAVLFAGAKVRGMLTSPTLATALTAYMLTDKEQEELAHKLAEVNQAAQKFTYTRDMLAVGLTPHIEESLTSRVGDLISWGRAQVASIVSTFQGMFSSFLGGLPDDADVTSQADGWMDRYGAYKSEQIANVAWGTGANDGTNAAIEDVLDATDDPDQTQKYPAAGRVRVRVVPGESSSDRCADYAGRDYSIEEYRALGIVFPAHPSCIHSSELFVGEGEAA